MKVLNAPQKEKFIEIVRILNRYYDLRPNVVLTPAMAFRKALESMPMEDFKIEVIKLRKKKGGQYQYQINAIVGEQKESWIHIDGIKEQRDQLEKAGIVAHPVFDITCLTDLYQERKKRKAKEKALELRAL